MRKPHPSPPDELDLLGLVRRTFGSAPPQATDWLKAGAVRTSARLAGRAVRRNPALAVAAAVIGVGLLAYAAYRKRNGGVPTPRPADAPTSGASGRAIDADAVLIETRSRRTLPRT